MKLSTHEAIFLMAWAASRTVAEVLNRMAGELTREEAWRLATNLRGRGLPLPPGPAALGIKRPVVLTPHPTDGDGRLDARGWHASRPDGAIEVGPGDLLEGPWGCRCCRRRSRDGWSLVMPDVDGLVTHEFACDRCVALVG